MKSLAQFQIFFGSAVNDVSSYTFVWKVKMTAVKSRPPRSTDLNLFALFPLCRRRAAVRRWRSWGSAHATLRPPARAPTAALMRTPRWSEGGSIVVESHTHTYNDCPRAHVHVSSHWRTPLTLVCLLVYETPQSLSWLMVTMLLCDWIWNREFLNTLLCLLTEQ